MYETALEGFDQKAKGELLGGMMSKMHKGGSAKEMKVFLAELQRAKSQYE
jgi:hypothetical protein